MANSDEPDVAARVAAINREYDDTLQRIKEEYEVTLQAARNPRMVPSRHMQSLRPPLSPSAADAKREQLIREADERRRVQLETLDLEQRLLEGSPPTQADTTAPNGEASRRRPVSRGALTEAAKLLTKGVSRNEVARRTGLSTRLIDGYIEDMKIEDEARRLRWSEDEGLGLPLGTRTTSDGLVVLPEQ